MAEKETKEGKQVIVMTMTKDEMHDMWFQLHMLKMGPPDSDGYYRLILEPSS